MELWRRKTAHTVTVEAIRLNEDNVEAVALWCGGDLIEEIDPEHPEEKQYGINVGTNNGIKRASLGMYICKYARRFVVHHTRVFEDLYEPVNRDSPPPESIGDALRQRGFGESLSTAKVI